MSALIVKIDGMSCQNCVRHVTEALEEIPGVGSVSVSLEESQAVVESEGSIGEDQINAVIDEAGYTVVSVSPL